MRLIVARGVCRGRREGCIFVFILSDFCGKRGFRIASSSMRPGPQGVMRESLVKLFCPSFVRIAPATPAAVRLGSSATEMLWDVQEETRTNRNTVPPTRNIDLAN